MSYKWSSSRFWTGPVQDWTGPVSDLFLDQRRSVCGIFGKLYTRHRAVEGHAAVWQIAKSHACVRRPLLSVGLIAQQWRGLVRWGGWAGHEPTSAASQMHKSLSFCLRRDHGGDQRELPMQVSAAAMSVLCGTF